MPTELDPIAENWYSHLDKGQRFTVTAVNEKEGTVELQHFDGDIEEITLEDWYNLDVELCEEPENWAGAVDISEVDDFGTEITDTSEEDWKEPLSQFRNSKNERPEEEESGDTWAEGGVEEQPLETEK